MIEGKKFFSLVHLTCVKIRSAKNCSSEKYIMLVQSDVGICILVSGFLHLSHLLDAVPPSFVIQKQHSKTKISRDPCEIGNGQIYECAARQY